MPGRQWTVSGVASQSQENFQPCGKRKRKFTFDRSFDGFGKPATSSPLVSEVHMATAGAERTTRTKKRTRRLLPALRQPTRERDPLGRPAALTPCCVRPPRAELARGPWSWRHAVPPLLPLCAPHSPSPVPPPPPRASETAGPTSPRFLLPSAALLTPWAPPIPTASVFLTIHLQTPKPISTFSSFR